MSWFGGNNGIVSEVENAALTALQRRALNRVSLGFGRGAEYRGAKLLIEAEEEFEAGHLGGEGLGAVDGAVESGANAGQGRGHAGEDRGRMRIKEKPFLRKRLFFEAVKRKAFGSVKQGIGRWLLAGKTISRCFVARASRR